MTVLTASVARERLQEMLTSGRVYDFAAGAAEYLAVHPGDHQLRLVAAGEFLKLGLVLPARELLDAPGPRDAGPPEIQQIRAKLESITSRPTPWSRHADRFAANLTALEHRGIDVEAIRGAWDDAKDLCQLFRDANGLTQIRRIDADGVWQWIPFLGDHQAADEARAFPQDIENFRPGPYLFAGLGLGGFLERVYQQTLNTFHGFSCALYIAEPDRSSLALTLHLHDWAELLADPRVFVFTGGDCAEQMRETLNANLDLPLPTHAFKLGVSRASGQPDAIEAMTALTQDRASRTQQSLADLNDHYAGRDVAFWAKRFDEALSGAAPPLRILAAVSRHTTFLKYSMRDTQRALGALGHRCEVVIECNDHEVTSPLTFHRRIRTFDPDLFFVYDHLRPALAATLPDNLPLLSWDQDQLPHAITAENIRRVARHDFVTGYSKDAFLRAGRDPKQYLYARVPTCPEQFDGAPLTDEQIEQYACDVSYVSHASQTPRQFHDSERKQFVEPKLIELLDTMYELTPEVLAEHHVMCYEVTHRILDEASRRCGIRVQDEQLIQRLLWWYLWRLGDRLFRHEALEWVAAWAQRTGRSLRVYGKGWDQHPTLSAFAVGPVENGEALRCVYLASRINLQLMPSGFLHQRALDGLAAGGFFLTRAVPHDQKGKLLRQLLSRIHALGITDTPSLLGSDDPDLRSLLHRYMGRWLDRTNLQDTRVLDRLRIRADLEFPDEVFPRFGEIVFGNADQFESLADRYLADPDLRGELCGQMRSVVLERFTYRATMSQFLRAMSAYLRHAARDA